MDDPGSSNSRQPAQCAAFQRTASKPPHRRGRELLLPALRELQNLRSQPEAAQYSEDPHFPVWTAAPHSCPHRSAIRPSPTPKTSPCGYDGSLSKGISHDEI